mgnify:CR=1 FL=1
MKKCKLKKIISVTLSLIMLLSMVVIPNNTFAADTMYPEADAYSETRADISFEYLGTSPAGTIPLMATDLPTNNDVSQFKWEQSGYVWVGVYFSYMDQLKDMFAKGMQSMVLTLAYDPTYFTTNQANVLGGFAFVNGQKTFQNPSIVATYPWEDIGMFDANYVVSYAENTVANMMDSPTGSDKEGLYPMAIANNSNFRDFKMANATITWNDQKYGGSTDRMYEASDYASDQPTRDENKQLVAVFPLQMVGDTKPTAGSKVLEGLLATTYFTMNFEGGQGYQFVRNPETSQANNLRNKFNVVKTLVDLFPAAGATHDVTVSKTTDIAATITVDPSVSPVGDAYTLEEGKSYTFTATPSSKEYVFDNWTYGELHSDWVQTDGNKVTVTIPAGQTLTSPTIIANFKSNEYSLTVNGDNGTVSVEDSEGSPASAIGNVYTVYGGETYTLSATAGTGYKFSNWTSSDLTLSPDNNTAEVTFTMPEKASEVTANFTPKTAPTISGAGTFDKNGGTDIALTYSGDYVLSGITGLTPKTDYTVSGNTITIKADYLKKQNTGAHELTFEFTGYTGEAVTHTITISNSATATIEIGNVTNPTKREYTYPETLNLDGLEFTMTTKQTGETDQVKKYKFEGTDWKTGDGYAGNPADDVITLKFNDTDTTVATHGVTVMKQAQNGKAITIAKDGATPATTGTFTVHKKAITITSNLSANIVTKTYDGNTTIADTAAIKNSLSVNGAVGSDNISVGTNGVNATYNNENAADKKTINVTGIAISGTNTDEYTFNSTLNIENAGQITKKNLTVTGVTVPAAKQFETVESKTVNDSSDFTTNDKVSGDNVTLTYNYQYSSTDVAGSNIDVTVTPVSLGGADGENYQLNTSPITVKGTVTAATIASIEVTGQPTQTATKATHGDTIDLSQLAVTVHYVGGASNVFTGINDITGAGITLTWTNGGAVTGSEELRHDTHNGKTITATLNDKTATTDAFIVDKAVLTPSVSKTGDITKVYDNTNTVPDEEKAKITVTFDDIKGDDSVTATFDAVYAGVNVNASETINITNIAPSGTDAENYTVTSDTDDSLTGAIKQRPLTVNITSVPSIFEGDEKAVTLTETTNFTVSNKIDGDDVTVTVTGTYSSNSQGTDVPVTYAASITGGTSAGNYSVNATPTGPNGTVLANGVKTIVINNQPNKTEYTHGDKLDLNGLEFTTTTNGGDEKKYKFDNGAWVSDGTYDGDPNASTDENEVSVQYNGSDVEHNTTVVRKDTANNSIIITGAAATESVALTVNAKELIPQISGSDIDKPYDGNVNASVEAVTAVIKDKDTEVVTGDDVSINVVSAVYPDKDKDDASVNLTVECGLTGTHASCYTLGTAKGNATGKIDAKVVTITELQFDPVYVGATGDDLTVDVHYGYKNDDDFTLMAGAGVELIGVTATYPDANTAGEKTVNISFDVTGNDKGNFTFATDPATVTGEVKDNSMESFVVKTEPNMTYEYGDWFDFIGTVIEVTYTDGSKKEFTYDAGKDEFVNGGEELEYTAALKDKEGNTETINVDDQVDIADAGKTIEFTVTGITNSTAQTTGTMTVNKKKINEIHISATGETTKVYDATAAVNGTFAFEASNVVGSDDVSFTGITYVYANKNVGEDIAITFDTSKIAVGNGSDKYELADTVTYKYYQDGAEQAGGLTGDITVRTVNITGITAGTTTIGNAGKVQATATIGTEEDKTAMLTDGIVVSVFVTYADEDVTAVGTPDVDVSYEVTLDPNTAKDNYNFVLESLAVKGNVTDNKITGLEIVKEPTKTQYEYGEKLDLTGVEVKVTYNDDENNTETFVFDGTKWTVDGVEKPFPVDITWNSDETNTPLDITNTTVTKTDSIKFTAQENVSVTTVTAVTGEITVGNAQLTVTAEGTAVKVYDGTTAVLDDDKNTITFKVTDKNGNVVSGVEVLADAVYASKDAGEVQITFSNIRFADDTNNGKYTLPTEIAPINGTINKRQLTIGTITVPSVKKGASATVTATNSTSFKLADTSLPIVEIDGKKDTVKISYTATYSSTATTGSNIAATIDNTTLAITADDNAVKNYELAPFTGTATGTVSSGGSSGGGGGGGLAISISITKLNDETNEYEVVKDDLEGVVGDKITLGYEFSSNPANKEVEWLTSDEKIATVDENGVVTFVGEGEVEITVRRKTSTSTKDTVTIKVTQPEATPTPEVTPEPTERPSLVDKEILSPYIVGYEDGAFGPERTISREEVAAIFARLLVNKIDMDENYEVSFSDIPDTAWSKNYIGFLEDFGILNGYEDGTYRPYNSITRAEMAVIIAKVEGYDVSGTDMTTKFSDIDSGYDSWATQSIKVLTEDGVIEGYEDGTFRPGNGITRAETVSMINRILDAMEVEEIKVRPTDVTDAHWAYEDIIKAMNDRVLKDVAISNSPNGETEEN